MPIDVHIMIAVEEFLKSKGLRITQDLVHARNVEEHFPEKWIELSSVNESEKSVRVTATISLTVEAVFGVTSIQESAPKNKLNLDMKSNVIHLDDRRKPK